MNQPYLEWISEACEQIGKGAFLTTGQDHNPMTIGWGQFGVVWGKPVCTVFVRKSRYTHDLIEKAATFTVSVPFPDAMKEARALCGTKSGRDMDKMRAANLTVLPAKAGGADGVGGCALYFECRTVFQTESDLKDMDVDILNRYYAGKADDAGDPHTVYFGEILAAYRG